MIVSYDGTRYRGWQRLPNADTIQGRIEAVLSDIFGQPTEISGSGRTDAGVHARMQVVTFTSELRPIEKLLARLHQLLPADIGVQRLCYAPDRFHARLSASEKTYVYHIHNAPSADVFMRKYRTQIIQKLDVEKMRIAAEKICGTHDFAAFCANKHYKKSTVRTIKRLQIEQDGENLRIVMTADGFLYNMARIIAGTLIEVGLSRREIETIDEIFASKRRENAGQTAPAKGLCLTEVGYEHSDFWKEQML